MVARANQCHFHPRADANEAEHVKQESLPWDPLLSTLGVDVG
jgi:hypothetical protein